MDLSNKLLKQIDETRYLTADNAWRYRSILRYFYLQYEKMKYWIYKEDVFDELKLHPEFQDYTMDQCRLDLDVLLGWKNLLAMQDTAKVATVEEFKNKQFRYQLSEYSIEIERMTIRLENLHIESASLEPSLLERIREALKQLPEMAYTDFKTTGMWWGSLSNDFKSLNQNYQDYIRDLYGIKAEELMKTQAFILFKDKFIEYLRDFIKNLQFNAHAIETMLSSFSQEEVNHVLGKSFEYDKSIPRMDEVAETDIMDNIKGKWRSILSFFIGTNGHESEVSRILDLTNEIIRKITRYASQIAENSNSAANRKEEYKKLAEMFLNCSTMEEAHKLSSLAFGLFHMKHIKGNAQRRTESINSGIFEEMPYIEIIKPRVRTYREKMNRNPIPNHEERKRASFEKIKKQRDEEQKIMNSYIMDGTIDFAHLPKIKTHVRLTLLRWLSKGLTSADKRGKTEDGRIFRVIEPENNQKCILDCEDGELLMPSYVIRFER